MLNADNIYKNIPVVYIAAIVQWLPMVLAPVSCSYGMISSLTFTHVHHVHNYL